MKSDSREIQIDWTDGPARDEIVAALLAAGGEKVERWNGAIDVKWSGANVWPARRTAAEIQDEARLHQVWQRQAIERAERERAEEMERLARIKAAGPRPKHTYSFRHLSIGAVLNVGV